MKDRLENFEICNTSYAKKAAKQVESLFDLLYDKLNQFDKLSTLIVKKNTIKVIQALGYITHSCKTLEAMYFKFSFPAKDINSSTSIKSVSNSTIEFSSIE